MFGLFARGCVGIALVGMALLSACAGDVEPVPRAGGARLVWTTPETAIDPALRERAARWAGWAPGLTANATLLQARGGWRRGRVCVPGHRYEARVVLPASGRARLTLSYALDVEGPPAGAVLTLTSRAVELARLDASAVPRRAWHDVAVDLVGEPGAVQHVALEFSAGGAALAAVAEATVFEPLVDPPTVVLITSDTHRGDHVEFAPNGAGVRTPVLGALAARGLAFSDAFASSNITVPSHVALMTGLTPKDTGVLDNATSLAERARTLAEHFAEAGWATFAVTSTSLLDDSNAGLGQGFDRLSSPNSDDPKARTRSRRPADETLGVLESWWSAADARPLFVWLHVFDAHSPYAAPDELVEPYWPAARDPADPTLPEPLSERVPEWAVGVRDLEYLRARYKAGASWVDRGLERVLQRERVRRGWVAVTSDHGENLGEHDIWWTHKDVYRQTLHVPLVLAGPGVPAGRMSAVPVSMIDLGRTLLDLAGLADVEHPGQDLVDVAAGRAQAPRPRFAVSGRTRSASIAWDGFLLVKKLVDHRLGQRGRFVAAGEIELFDLRADSAGLVDVAAAHPERATELEAWLERWLATPSAGLAGTTKDDAETRRALAELGYLDETEE